MPNTGRRCLLPRFLRPALCAAAIGLISQAPARATTFMGFFPTIPVPTPTPQPPPPTGGDTPGTPPSADTPPTIPPIFNWIEPPEGGGGDQGGPPIVGPPVDISSAPEPATVIGGLIGMSVLGFVGVWHRRQSK